MHPQATDPALAALDALQSQFTVFNDGLGRLRAEVKDVLDQLRAVRTAQNKADKSIAELEGVIGVARPKERARRARARGGPDVHATDAPEKTLIQTLASIQSAIDELARSGRASPYLAPPSFVNPIESCRTSQPASSQTGKDYADASIQARPSPPSCTLSLPLDHVPEFRPFPWNPDSRDNSSPYAQLPTMSPASFSSNPSHPVSDDSAAVLPMASNPPYMPNVISSESSPIPNSLTQTSLTPMTSPDVPPPIDTCASSPLSSPSGINGAPIPSSGASPSAGAVVRPVTPHTMPSEDVRMTTYAGRNEVPFTERTNVTSEPMPAHHQIFPLEVDDGRLTSDLSTPPSESINITEPPIVQRAPAMSLKMMLHIHNPKNFPVIPTPPCLTPEPSSGGQVLSREPYRQCLLGELLSPPLLSPSTAVGSNDEMVAEEKTDSAEDAAGLVACELVATDGVGADASVNDPGSRPQIGEANVEQHAEMDHASSSSPTDPVGVEEATSVAVSPDDSILVPRTAGSIDILMPDVPFPEYHAEANSSDPYSLLGAFTFGSSPPLRRLSPSASPSRNTTPSVYHDPSLARDEDEVWRTLMFGASGVSTPLSDSTPPLMLSHQHSRASSIHPSSEQHSSLTPTSEPELLAIDPSMLHDSVPPPHVPRLSSPQSSDESLSPLTSLADSDVDSAITHSSKKPHAGAPANGGMPGKNGRRERRSESHRAWQPSRSLNLPSAALEMSATSGRIGSPLLGGPDASLEELVMLAMRKPSKNRARLRDLKRKRDAADDGRDAERGVSVDEASQQDEEESTSVSRRQVGKRTTPPALRALESAVGSGCFDGEGEGPNVLPAYRKKTKKKGEHGGNGAHGTHRITEHAHTSQQRLSLATNSRLTLPKKFHFRFGQIVSVESEREPTHEPEQQLQAPVASQPSIDDEQADQDLRTPTRKCHRKDGEDDSMKTPLASSVKQLRATQSGTNIVGSSLVKENARSASSDDNVLWPDLPAMFSQWHVQFIQCDNCDMWYHYGCVAIESGDPRLESGVLFICPTCQHESARRQTLRHHTDTCTRPDCPEPQLTGDSDVFFVEKLVGRKKAEGYIYLWLAKWEGFPMTQATWIPKENVVGDGAKLFNAFQQNAESEGADLSQDMVLLQEALESGWGDNGHN